MRATILHKAIISTKARIAAVSTYMIVKECIVA